MRKTILSLALAIGLILAGVSGQAATIELKAGHTLAPDHPYHLGLLYLADLLKERSNGEINLQAFHSSQLGSERELIEALQMGTTDMTIISTAPLAGFTKRFLVYDLPFIFPDAAAARRILDGPIGQGTLESVEGIDLIGLTFFENGFRHVTNSKLPIRTPDDAKGIKIRTMENKIHMASFEAIGATPTPMAFGELYTALQQKTIDAQENPIPIIYTSKFYEVQKYCSLTGHFYSPTPMFISKTAWNRLSEEQKDILVKAAAEARDYQRQMIDEQNAKFVDELKANGMEVIEVDKSVWLTAMEPVYKKYESEIGPEVIKAIRDEISKE
ncbi:MAG: TRAP transporter substrate-binding protein [Deltaproteobacteria bacterium]|jgi:tripartite ATP-independent transporter DctP family solute receptor|nr:TRAP transporter substrate-binding protein [Deltaproteobacteria bacterium]